jgi:YidC/Oxa1 family membrane protein insertase
MIGTLWNLILINPILNALVFLNDFTGNLGIALIIFTIFMKLITLPATLPAMKMAKKQKDIQPELNKIKEKFKYDKKKQAELQMELFKKHGINPAGGCLTTIVTLFLMIAVYRVVVMFTGNVNINDINARMYFPSFRIENVSEIKTQFTYLNLSKPDPLFITPIIAAILQFLATKMMLPLQKDMEKNAKQTPEKEDDMMVAMQQQNLYLMPIMFFMFGLTLPSGAMLYILTSTLFQIVQTYYFNGWGGLEPWAKKAGLVKVK